tara:strand:- start:218 stop:574 length:357 start_codon:yes stop_codon:yes gene_type:complete
MGVTNNQPAFDSTQFHLVLKEMNQLVSKRLINDLDMNTFDFGVKFGILYKMAKNRLQHDLNTGARLPSDVRIQLIDVGQKLYQYRIFIEDACFHQHDNMNDSLARASKLLQEIITGEA